MGRARKGAGAGAPEGGGKSGTTGGGPPTPPTLEYQLANQLALGPAPGYEAALAAAVRPPDSLPVLPSNPCALVPSQPSVFLFFLTN